VPIYFVDSSALCKRYVVEIGSAWLTGLLEPAIDAESYISRITAVEVVSAITRRERNGTLTKSDAGEARNDFRLDLNEEETRSASIRCSATRIGCERQRFAWQ